MMPSPTRISPRRLSRCFFLRLDRLLELRRRDHAALEEDVAEPVAAVHDRGVADPAPVEVDGAEVVPVRDREAAGLLPHGEELQHVGEARLLEAALDRHQRNSSITRAHDVGPVPDDLLRVDERGIARVAVRRHARGTPAYGVDTPSSRRTSAASSARPGRERRGAQPVHDADDLAHALHGLLARAARAGARRSRAPPRRESAHTASRAAHGPAPGSAPRARPRTASAAAPRARESPPAAGRS